MRLMIGRCWRSWLDPRPPARPGAARREEGRGAVSRHRIPTLRYRAPFIDGAPPVGAIVMGNGPRVRRAYRILLATKTKSSLVGLGVCTWKLLVEPMSAAAGRDEIDAGAPHWEIVWDKREKRYV